MSAAPKSRLGRGLGGLIASAAPAASKADQAAPATPVAATPSGAPGYQEIAVSMIEPSPYQARRERAGLHRTARLRGNHGSAGY